MGTWLIFLQMALALMAGWVALVPLMASLRARRIVRRAQPSTSSGQTPGVSGGDGGCAATTTGHTTLEVA
ncbi:MAG: hypothetical protein HXY37_16395 [Chloroflexi bacterium]|nr:hypothetical protein [Chloroflexota bacterium]